MNIGDIGKGAQKIWKNGVFTKRGPRTIANFGTGINGTRLLTSIGVLGGAVVGGFMLGKTESEIDKTGPFSEYGNLPQISYDAVANGNYRTGSRDLGATGNLVFGLNSGRHGK